MHRVWLSRVQMNPISRNALLILFDTISGPHHRHLAVAVLGGRDGRLFRRRGAGCPVAVSRTGAKADVPQGYQCNNQHSPDSPTACSNPASNASPATPISLTFAVNNVNGNTVSVSYNGTPAQCIIASNTSACSNFPQFWVNPANPVYVNGIYGTGALQTPLTVQSSCSPNQICMSATVPLASNTTTTISAQFDAVTGLLLSYTETFVNIGTGTFNGDNTEFLTFQIAPPYPLTVIETGNGSVSSAPGGIAAGLLAAPLSPAGTPVTLTPAGPAGMSFAGWGGACSGTGACTVTMNSLAGSRRPSVRARRSAAKT